MHNFSKAAAIVLILGTFLSSGIKAQVADSTAFNKAALEWVGLLRDRHFDEAAARVDPAAATQLSANQLENIWTAVLDQLGGLQSVGPGPVMAAQGYHVVDLLGTFTNGTVTVRVTLNGDLLVSGLFFRPRGGLS